MNSKFNTIDIEKFYNTDFVDYASYDNLRKIASYTDGFKNASRKVIHTVLDKNLKGETKVSRLQSTIAEYTEYLHGEANLGSVIVNLAQNFTSTNNLPLIQRNGEFGCRHTPVASAARYIFTQKEKYLDTLINKYDRECLPAQDFEGVKIEPRHFVPILPLLLVNGSEGISTGFAQKILPRSVDKIFSELNKILKGTKKLENVNIGEPNWNGFSGNVYRDKETTDKTKWFVHGKIKMENTTTILIEEVPIGYDLKKYLDILDKLSEDNVIISYQDLSENDKFKFILKVKREFTSKYDEKSILHKLKLVQPITENYTVMDENNKIKIYTDVKKIFIDYYKLRLEYFGKRKDYQISIMNQELSLLQSKLLFIKNVIDGTININNKTKKSIVSSIEKIKNIITVDGNYDYLLRMPLYTLTNEKLKEIKDKISNVKNEINVLKIKNKEDMWLEDLSELKRLM